MDNSERADPDSTPRAGQSGVSRSSKTCQCVDYVSMKADKTQTPRFQLFPHLFSFTELQRQSGLKTETRSIVTLWEL